MQVTPIRTHQIAPNESLEELFDKYIHDLQEGDILAITSKIVSLSQGLVIPKETTAKEDLIKREADSLLDTEENPYCLYLTLKDGILIPSAGVDESNANDTYILYPKNIQDVAAKLWTYLREKYSLKNLGVLITDSHTIPLRRGVVGIALGWCGFESHYSYIGKPDIYGKPLQVTQMNLLDSLATTAVLVMGEGDEQTPMAIISRAPKVKFQQVSPLLKEIQHVVIPMEDDIYAPILMAAKWIKNR